MISGIFSGSRAVVALFVSTGFTTGALDLASGTRAVVALVVFTGFTTAALDLASGIFGKNGAGFATLHARERWGGDFLRHSCQWFILC